MKIIKTIFFLFILVILLPNTVSAEAAIGPPIGEVEFVFSPSDTVLPNEDVTVTIKWWITNESYTYYFGPFNIHIELRDSDVTEVANWTIHTTETFGYQANASSPYTYKFTKNAPSEIGEYSLDVQIVANGLEREVGKSDNEHRLLVGSNEESLTTIPEFATLAIPMIIAILSGLFFLNHRKRREE